MSFLAATQCPVLLFRGDNGWPADSEEEERRRVEAFGDRLTVRHVPGSHHLHLDEVWTAVRDVISTSACLPASINQLMKYICKHALMLTQCPHTSGSPRARWTGSSSPPSPSYSRRSCQPPRRKPVLPRLPPPGSFE